MTMMDPSAFAQVSTLGASLVLLFGIALLWRRSLRAYVQAFQWQSFVLTLLIALIAFFSQNPEIYVVAAFLFILKVLVIPRYLNRLYNAVGGERESHPYVNVATSVIGAGFLVLVGYGVSGERGRRRKRTVHENVPTPNANEAFEVTPGAHAATAVIAQDRAVLAKPPRFSEPMGSHSSSNSVCFWTSSSGFW